LLSELNAKLIDEDEIKTYGVDDRGNPTDQIRCHPYELYSIVLPGSENNTPSVYLKMSYPSGPEEGVAVVECVPPWIQTCFQARAWRQMGGESENEFLKKSKDYRDPDILT